MATVKFPVVKPKRVDTDGKLLFSIYIDPNTYRKLMEDKPESLSRNVYLIALMEAGHDVLVASIAKKPSKDLAR